MDLVGKNKETLGIFCADSDEYLCDEAFSINLVLVFCSIILLYIFFQQVQSL